MNKTNKILYSALGLIVYVGFMVGLGFILNLFWKVGGTSATMYWITTAVVCLCVAFYVLLLLFLFFLNRISNKFLTLRLL